jgi:hypothetical protein
MHYYTDFGKKVISFTSPTNEPPATYFLTVKSDVLRLHDTILNVTLVTEQHDRFVLVLSSCISVPIRNIFVRHSAGDVKHDDKGFRTDTVR